MEKGFTSNSLESEGSDWWCIESSSRVMSCKLEIELSANITNTSYAANRLLTALHLGGGRKESESEEKCGTTWVSVTASVRSEQIM